MTNALIGTSNGADMPGLKKSCHVSVTVIFQYFRNVFVSIFSCRDAHNFLYPSVFSSCIFAYIKIPTIPAAHALSYLKRIDLAAYFIIIKSRESYLPQLKFSLPCGCKISLPPTIIFNICQATIRQG